MPEHFTQADYSLVSLRKEERAGPAPRVFRFINRLVSPLPNWPLPKDAGLLGKMGLSPDHTHTEKTHLASQVDSTSRRRMLSSTFLFFLRVFSSPADWFLRKLCFYRLLHTSPAEKNLQISFRNNPARQRYGGLNPRSKPAGFKPRWQRRRLPTGRQRRRRCGSSFIVLC
jgi:hypothetical protein